MKIPDIGRKIRVLAIHTNDWTPRVKVGDEITVINCTVDGSYLYVRAEGEAFGTWITAWEYVDEPGEKAEAECSRCGWRGRLEGLRTESGVPLCPMPLCQRVVRAVEPEATEPAPYVYAPGQRTAETKWILVDGDSPEVARRLWDQLDQLFPGAREKWVRIEAAAQEPVRKELAEACGHLDAIARALHPHWRGDGHTFIPEQLPGMVQRLMKERDEANARAEKAEAELAKIGDENWYRAGVSLYVEQLGRIALLEKVVEAADEMRRMPVVSRSVYAAYDEARAALDATNPAPADQPQESEESLRVRHGARLYHRHVDPAEWLREPVGLDAAKQDSPPSPENTFAGSARISVQSGARDDGGATTRQAIERVSKLEAKAADDALTRRLDVLEQIRDTQLDFNEKLMSGLFVLEKSQVTREEFDSLSRSVAECVRRLDIAREHRQKHACRLDALEKSQVAREPVGGAGAPALVGSLLRPATKAPNPADYTPEEWREMLARGSEILRALKEPSTRGPAKLQLKRCACGLYEGERLDDVCPSLEGLCLATRGEKAGKP